MSYWQHATCFDIRHRSCVRMMVCLCINSYLQNLQERHLPKCAPIFHHSCWLNNDDDAPLPISLHLPPQNCEKRLSASSCRSVCPSACKQLSSHWTDFHEIWYLMIFRKYVKNINVSLKSDKNNGYFTWSPIYIFDHISLSSS